MYHLGDIPSASFTLVILRVEMDPHVAVGAAVAVRAQRPLLGRDGRVVLFAGEGDLEPLNRPSLRLAIELGCRIPGYHRDVLLGPLSPGDVDDVGIDVPARVEHASGDGDLARFGDAHTAPGDVLIVTAHAELKGAAAALYESGRSVLAAAQNPESQSSVNGSTLTFPVGGSV